MNEKYLIGEEGVKVYEKNGEAVGYEFGARVPYYFGVPLSQVAVFNVDMDGVQEPRESIELIMDDGAIFSLDDIATVNSYHWAYGKKMRVGVLRDGGLAKGPHRLEVEIGIAVIYGGGKGFRSKAYFDFEV